MTMLLLAAACSGRDATDREQAAHDHDHGPNHEPVTMQVDDPFAQADMATLSQESDAVVRGTVVAADGGVRVGSSDRLLYTAFTVEVDEALAGAPGDRVEVILASEVDGRPVAIEGRPLPHVGDRGLWFLTAIAPQFQRDGYVLTGQSGLLLFEGDEVVGGGPGKSAVAAEVARLDSPEAVVDHVRSVAG